MNTNHKRLLEHIGQALDYFESYRAVVYHNGVVVIDTKEGGAIVIGIVQVLHPFSATEPVVAEQKVVFNIEPNTMPPMDDEDIPF